MATKKSGSGPSTKSSASQKKAAVKVVKKVGKAAVRKVPKKYRRSAVRQITPYFLMVFAVVLLICYIMTWVQDGAGVVGNAIYTFFCGMLGGIPSVLLILVLGFVGVIWCIFHILWKESDANAPRESEGYLDYKKSRKKTVFRTVMACVLLLLVSGMMGSFAAGMDGAPSFDIPAFYENGSDALVSGGVLGDMLAFLMITCFTNVGADIILVLLVLIVLMLLIGITPEWIVAKVRAHRIARMEKKALEEEEWERQYAAAQAAAPAKKASPVKEPPKETPAPPVYEEKKSKKRGMTVDELMEEPASEEDAPPLSDPEPDIVITLPEEPREQEEASFAVGEDFGGDPAFDTNEYSAIDSFFTQAPSASSQAQPAPVEEPPLAVGEIGAEELLSDLADVDPEEGESEPAIEPEMPYVFPSIELLEKNRDTAKVDYSEEMNKNARILVETLKSFRVGVQSINCSRGPTITRYELKPEVGTRVRSIANLVDDISLSLATSGVRIEAPIPGKAAVGIEVPNENRTTVYLRELLEDSKFTEAKSRLTSALGKDVGGNPIFFDVAKMPHLLIAGATGMGKSVCINCLIVSILYKARPSEVKLILVDPKKVEFAIYKDIPHLYAPIVSDPKKAAGALASAVAEMERRFGLIEQAGVRDISTYNAMAEGDPEMEKMPHMVIIIDELADLMMTAPDEVESSICRLAQKARAAGIHLVIGTQRPSVDVITGLIKANVPSRIACTVASQVDSRTIIDIAGAEKLIGRGDMLFAPVGSAKPLRVQGAFVSEAEVEKIVSFIRDNNAKAKYNNDFISRLEEEAAKCGTGKKGGGEAVPEMNVEGGDEKFRDAVKLAIEEGKISTSLMQRRLSVGFGRAARIIDTMEKMGYVSKQDGTKPRRVLITMEEYSRRVMEGSLGSSEE